MSIDEQVAHMTTIVRNQVKAKGITLNGNDLTIGVALYLFEQIDNSSGLYNNLGKFGAATARWILSLPTDCTVKIKNAQIHVELRTDDTCTVTSV